ncbi:hypothetical protein C6P45_000970 [Maudiozyma exigua]|uniref:Peroxisomal membrane protein PEX25 n=1 Tax=Maudiozyma exigua TaxID=34358 RepID=A0A9P7BB30_MAUEX|nr:hypothetical protein C6P45_000970 [Kazachstania exigua]
MDSSYLHSEELMHNHYATDIEIGNIFNQKQMTEEGGMVETILENPDDNHNDQEKTMKIKIPKHEKKLIIDNMEILHYLINSLSGKDKIAKILKYILQIVKMFITKFLKQRKFINSGQIRLTSLYNLQNLKNLLLQPNLFISLVFLKINQKLSYVIEQLGTYRYILRFGNSPFLIYNMMKNCSKLWNYKDKNLSLQQTFFNHFCNETTFRELINLYYTICDELVLLHKFKIWSNPSFYDTIMKHECWTWQTDILLNVKDSLIKLSDLQNKELEYTIQLQVKRRATQLYVNKDQSLVSPIRKQLLHDLRNFNETDNENIIINRKLKEIKQEIRFVYFDLIKLSFDGCANSLDIFNIKAPPLVYPLLSLGSGITSLIKMWKQARIDIIKTKAKEK